MVIRRLNFNYLMRLLNMAPTKDSVAEKNQSDSKRGCCERGG